MTTELRSVYVNGLGLFSSQMYLEWRQDSTVIDTVVGCPTEVANSENK